MIAFRLIVFAVTSMFATFQSTSCDDAVHGQFDFWLGSWDVYNPAHEHVGTNTIRSEEGGCALIERWQGKQGSGMSINYVDPSTGRWRQNWVGSTGYLVELEGGPKGDAFVMEGTLTRGDGTQRRMRGTWTSLEDGRVRQQFDVADSTSAWTKWFDGYYERKDGD